MTLEKRRVLEEDEKQALLSDHINCYICNTTLAGYNNDEIQYDHIYNYADGYDQQTSNFAPVHSSKDERKLNCHKAKGQKSPIQYREELRIINKLKTINGLGDLCKTALKSIYVISKDKKSITFNGKILPLYNQRINSKDNYYFFDEVETKFIENDELIQLRPLEPKILPLIFNLKGAVQLLPSLGRLDESTQTIKIFDGQHKAVAQIIGNNKEHVSCLIFVHPNVDELRVVIYQAHTDFVQQKYKKSHIDAKLAAIYQQRIDAFREKVGDPKAPYTEEIILRGESKAKRSHFLLSSIKEEIALQTNFIRDFAAQDKPEQKTKPILWQSLDKIIGTFCNTEAVTETSDSENNFREDEISNIVFILSQIEEHSIKNKWEPTNQESKNHIVARTYYYRTAFNNWINTLEEAMRYALEQMNSKKIAGALCYRKPFEPIAKQRFSEIIRKLFDHPIWVKENKQIEIAQSNNDASVGKIFEKEGLDYIYLTKL
jgi:hypothetical protein